MKFIPLICSMLLLLSNLSLADDLNSNQQKLTQLQSSINELKTKLQKQQQQQSSAQQKLSQSEQDIAKNRKELGKIQSNIDSQTRLLKELSQSQSRQQQQIDGKETEINALVLSTWQQSQQPKLKILIENPNQSQRLMSYFDYFSTAQLAKLKEWQTAQQQLALTKQLAKDTLDNLEKNKLQALSSQTKLAQLKQQRSEFLQQSKQAAKSIEEQINTQLEEQNQVSQLIETLQKLEFARQQTSRFRDKKGKMPRPVPGKILQNFGQKLAQGRITSAGVVFNASVQQEIAAIHSGTVIFASFMKGLGNLVVIDHGDNYMSLYSRTEANLVTEGEQISAGDIIAIAGNSGGQDNTSLYLELRHNGQPVNPMLWLNSQ